MTIQDPNEPPTHTAYAAEVRETTVVRERDNTVWWIAGIVALAAIAAVVWMVLASNRGADDTEAMQDALEAARVEAQLAGAEAQMQAAGDAAARAAADAARATADARDAAARAASQPPTVIVESPPPPAVEPEPEPVPPPQ